MLRLPMIRINPRGISGTRRIRNVGIQRDYKYVPRYNFVGVLPNRTGIWILFGGTLDSANTRLVSGDTIEMFTTKRWRIGSPVYLTIDRFTWISGTHSSAAVRRDECVGKGQNRVMP